MTLTIDLTDEQIIALVQQLPEARRERLFSHFDYPENGEWVFESVPGDERMDADTFAAVQEGIAQLQAGESYTLEEVDEHIAASLAEWKRTRSSKL